jgi:formylglycine-generating enzyme required for sulfatase activity
VILPDLVGNNPQLGNRFRHEAILAASIHHRNVISVTDFGMAQGIMPFLVMEFMEGESLAQFMHREYHLSPDKALKFIEPICAGVGAAHRMGIVHRDLKPLNIMIQDNTPLSEAVKVLDFGLAKIRSADATLSMLQAQTSGFMGSPAYMAPEQWMESEVNNRTDIYSLGVITYQMLTGVMPFQATSIPALMRAHTLESPISFASLKLPISPLVEIIVRRALEKDPENRPHTIEEFINEFRHAVVSTSKSSFYQKPTTGESTMVLPENFVPSNEQITQSVRNQITPLPEQSQQELKESVRQYEEEAKKRLEEESARRRAEEEARKRAEEKASLLAAQIEEAKKQAQEEARKRGEEEVRKHAEAEARLRAEEEAKRLAREVEEARKHGEEKASLLAAHIEEAKKHAQEEAQKRLEEESARRRAEEEARKRAEEKASLLVAQIEEAKKQAQEEARKRGEEEVRKHAEAEARLRAEEEAKRLAREVDEAHKRADELAKKRTEEEARKYAQEQARKQAEELEHRRTAEEAKKRLEEESARRRAEEEARKRAEEKASLLVAQIEEAKKQAQEEARKRGEEEVRKHAEAEARLRAEEEAKRLAREVEEARKREEKASKQNLPTVVTDFSETISNAASLEPHKELPPTIPFNQIQQPPNLSLDMDKTIALNLSHDISTTNPIRGNTDSSFSEPSNLFAKNNMFGTSLLEERKPPYLIISSIAAFCLLLILGAGIFVVYRLSQPKETVTEKNEVLPPESINKNLIEISGGEFLMGTNDIDRNDNNEIVQYPAHSETVGSFLIDKTEVTNEEYEKFIAETNHEPPDGWNGKKPPVGKEKYPVVNVSIKDANAFAAWRSKRDKLICRLPSEQEWEYAARSGAKNYIYPWGNEWKDNMENVGTNSLKPVDSYSQGTEVGGIKDMMGNVYEWTSSLVSLYPKNTVANEKNIEGGSNQYVFRGGAFNTPIKYRSKLLTLRQWLPPSSKENVLGFRLVCKK